MERNYSIRLRILFLSLLCLRPLFGAVGPCGVVGAFDDGSVEQRLREIPIDGPSDVIRLRTPAAENPRLATRTGEISLIQMNAQDFTVQDMKIQVKDFEHGGEKTVDLPAKSPEKLRSLARLIQENKGGIVVMEEVLGRYGVDIRKNLEAFSNEYLGGKFMVVQFAGNDSWAHGIAMLVRKDLPFEIEYRTYRDYRLTKDIPPYTAGKKVFSRDRPVMILRQPGARTPSLIVVGSHDKSKHKPSDPVQAARPDAGGDVMRQIQGDYGAAINMALDREFPGVPRLDAGDRNDDADRSPASAGLRHLMTNAFSFFHVPEAQRLTNFFFDDQTHQRVESATDSVFLNSAAKAPGLLLGVGLGQYTDDHGTPFVLPNDEKEAENFPSDHKPVILRMSLERLVAGPAGRQ